jgi:hypothetical protein
VCWNAPGHCPAGAGHDDIEEGAVRRVVLFKKKPDADPAAFAAAVAALAQLDRHVEVIDGWWVQENQGHEGMWDAAIVGDFADASAVKAYEEHPKHVEAATAAVAVADYAVFDSK